METNPRPPAEWWEKMWHKNARDYPRYKNESVSHWQTAISKITGGIWWKKYTPETREKLIKLYDSKKKLMTSSNPVMIPCPSCGSINSVSRSGIYIKCQKCGKNLVSVKVRRRH